jgi:predicted acylesterase/phospholipase RssA
MQREEPISRGEWFVPRKFRVARIYRPQQEPPQDSLKIALVLSGAVALGSFEAGVVSELLSAIGRGVPLTLDILAGSSAGSLVAAMAAKSLVMGAPFDYVLEKWTEFTLQELTAAYETEEEARSRRKPLDNGILSSEAVRRILEEYLVADAVDRSFQPAYPAPRVVLGATLTNLDGLPGTGLPGDETRFGEAVTFRFTPPDPHHLDESPYPPAVWHRIALIGRAGSGFPGAFDPERIPWAERLQIPGLLEEEWENSALLEQLNRQDPSLQPQMRYADGGILDEQPLERAVSMLPWVTGGKGEAGPETLVYDPRRCLLFIEPDPPATSMDGLKAGTRQSWFATTTRAVKLWSLSASPLTSQKRVANSNRRVERLMAFLANLGRRMREERRLPSVPGALQQFRTAFPEMSHLEQYLATDDFPETPGQIDPDRFSEAVQTFYDWLADGERFQRDLDWLDHLPPGRARDAHNSVRAQLLELREAYLSLRGVDPTAPGRYQAVLQEVHVSLARSLGLSTPWIALHQITPEDPKQMLQGEEIIHFGGFFSKKFLRHDFEVGRYYAHLWLTQAVPGYQSPTPPQKPPVTADGLHFGLFWQNRGPLWRMTGRVAAALLEAAGLAYGGAGQLLVRLLGWTLLLSAVHGLLLLIGAWVGWIRFAPEYQRFRFWILMGSSLFPLAFGLFLGLALRTQWARSDRNR